MKTYRVPYFEASIYMGAKLGYKNVQINKHLLILALQDWSRKQIVLALPLDLNVSDLTFVSGDYSEEGFKITTINYPVRPRDPESLRTAMCDLARYLASQLQQSRITLVIPGESMITFEAEGAEQRVVVDNEQETNGNKQNEGDAQTTGGGAEGERS